jgi:hypothetical protein
MSRHSGPLKTIKLVKELGLNELGKIWRTRKLFKM